MKEADSIDDYASKISGIVSKFQTLGTPIEENVLVKKLLTSAPTRFLPIVATIEHQRLFGQLLLTRSEWQEKHISEVKQVDRGQGSTPINHRGRGRGCGRFGSRGRGGRHPSNNNQRPEHAADQNSKRCYNCDRLGHFVADCQAPRRTEGEANLAREDDYATLLMVQSTRDLVMLNEEKVFPSEYAKDSTEKGTWYLDNGASNHMTGDRIYFSELDEKMIGRLEMVQQLKSEAKGRFFCSVKMATKDSLLIFITLQIYVITY
ncbi:uncharacterized protein LOC143604465 [Bidens hawaiensis]|uniref:uncharacterized protein LOC143604465 n=1 Tax=Bidens hawaiensis TaxID=980011 RepID=UPI004049241B